MIPTVLNLVVMWGEEGGRLGLKLEGKAWRSGGGVVGVFCDMVDSSQILEWSGGSCRLVADVRHSLLLLGAICKLKRSGELGGTNVILSRGGIKWVLIGLNPNCRLERLVPVTKWLARDGGGCVEFGKWTGGRGCWLGGC